MFQNWQFDRYIEKLVWKNFGKRIIVSIFSLFFFFFKRFSSRIWNTISAKLCTSYSLLFFSISLLFFLFPDFRETHLSYFLWTWRTYFVLFFFLFSMLFGLPSISLQHQNAQIYICLYICQTEKKRKKKRMKKILIPSWKIYSWSVCLAFSFSSFLTLSFFFLAFFLIHSFYNNNNIPIPFSLFNALTFK